MAGSVAPFQAVSAGFTALTFVDHFPYVDVGPNGIHNWYDSNTLALPIQTPSANYGHVLTSAISTSEPASSLFLTAMNNDGTWQAGTIYGADVNTFSGGRTFSYGYYEIDMRWQAIPGAFPTLMLSSYNFLRTPATVRNASIAIFQGQGGDPMGYYTSVHHGDTIPSTDQDTVTNNRFITDVDYTQFHTYGMLWTAPLDDGTPSMVTWYLDNLLLGSSPGFSSLEAQSLFITLSMDAGVGLVSGSVDGSVTATSFTAEIDSVACWGVPQTQ